MLDPLKIGFYILMFLPGFIFVQVTEHHLLREKKPQFEKTLEILLISVVIWFIAFYSPVWVMGTASRQSILDGIMKTVVQKGDLNSFIPTIVKNPRAAGIFFLAACIWTFIIANVWGIVRKFPYVDICIKWATGRDWYPSVAFRFYKENLDCAIDVTTTNSRYLGVLYSAPDCKDDTHIIITDPGIIVDGKVERLKTVRQIAIGIDEIKEIKSFKQNLLKKK